MLSAHARCEVYSYKEGLLSRLAHDLHWVADDVRLTLAEDRSQLELHLDPSRLRVLAAVEDGVDRPTVLSAGDRDKIHHTLVHEVLDVARFPTIHFRSRHIAATPRGYRVDGELTLHGATRALTVEVLREHQDSTGERLTARVVIHQPDYGIKPFSSALGALKVKADVVVQVTVELVGGA